jgi:transcriptional regulator of acetoin/glycerol metabolism
MDKTEQLIREIIKETLLAEKRRKKVSGRSFKPQNITDLLATRIKDPLDWRNDIYNAMSQADGRVPDAADSLGVSTRTLYRNLEDKALDDVDRAPMGRPVEK